MGWNLLHAAWPVLGGLGGWLLARELLDDDAPAGSALIAAAACATGPYLLATPWLGRTEILPGAAWPLTYVAKLTTKQKRIIVAPLFADQPRVFKLRRMRWSVGILVMRALPIE